jgi:hypothetical protein
MIAADRYSRRHPKRPVGFYARYLNELVERARAKRESDFVADRQFTAAVEIHEPLELPPCERKAA